MDGDLPEGVEYASIDGGKLVGSVNITGKGSESGSITAKIAPGDSVWIFAILQSLGANGAEVNASLTTKATFEQPAEGSAFSVQG